MRFTLPAVYPITDRRLSSLSHFEQSVRLIAGGASLIQIREKDTLTSDWFEDAFRTVKFAHSKGAIVLINDRVDVAMAVGADGVHLGQDDLPPPEARRLLGTNAIIGYSTHTTEQVRAAAHLPIDYIAFGPVFGTSTKKDAEDTVGLERLSKAAEMKGKAPLVAIGGIDDRSLSTVLAEGADSAAMIGFLVSEPDMIEQKMHDLLWTAKKFKPNTK